MKRNLALLLLCAAALGEEPAGKSPLEPLSWLVGSWAGAIEGPAAGGTIPCKAEWSAMHGGKFLRCEYAQGTGATAYAETLVLGFDAAANALAGHAFESTGRMRSFRCIEAKADAWTFEGRYGDAPAFRTTVERKGPDTVEMTRSSPEGRIVARLERDSAQATPRRCVEAWFAAVAAGDREKALSLGTETWRRKEADWDRSFTNAFFKAGLKLKAYEIRSEEAEGEEVRVGVGALLLDPKGEEDGEGMRFRLKRIDGRWWITDLD